MQGLDVIVVMVYLSCSLWFPAQILDGISFILSSCGQGNAAQQHWQDKGGLRKERYWPSSLSQKQFSENCGKSYPCCWTVRYPFSGPLNTAQPELFLVMLQNQVHRCLLHACRFYMYTQMQSILLHVCMCIKHAEWFNPWHAWSTA